MISIQQALEIVNNSFCTSMRITIQRLQEEQGIYVSYVVTSNPTIVVPHWRASKFKAEQIHAEEAGYSLAQTVIGSCLYLKSRAKIQAQIRQQPISDAVPGSGVVCLNGIRLCPSPQYGFFEADISYGVSL